MCTPQRSHTRKALTDLKDWGKAWGWTLALPALIISSASLWVAIPSHRIASRAAAPSVVATGARIKATADSNSYTLEVYFLNGGKEDATAITLSAGAVNLTTKEIKKLAAPQKFTRLAAANWEASTASFNVRKTDLLSFLVICISYGDGSGETTAPTFYVVPDRLPQLNGSDAIPKSVSAEERETLSSGFSCANMAGAKLLKRAVERLPPVPTRA